MLEYPVDCTLSGELGFKFVGACSHKRGDY